MSRPLLFRGFKSSQEILENGLGALEREVMSVAWSRDEFSVRDACADLESAAPYTTVMTTMDRVYKKSPLARRKKGRALMYPATAAQHELDVSLAMSATAGAAVIAAAGLRGVAAWWRASRRVRAWMRTAEPLTVPGARMPAYVIDVDAPLMALAGIWRPRLIVARGLVDALTPEELAASVAHEAGHQRARDNLKRLVMRAAPDFLPATAAARTIERRWASAAEHTADRLA